MQNKIPTSISGFPEWSPDQIKFEKKCKDIIEKNFATFGYVPLNTSSVELISSLTGIGADDKEIYALSRLGADEENEQKKYALHFDLTVPFARYISQRERDLTFPFKRYQIQNCFRGETPAFGRYREFTQCDIDVVSRGALPLSYDAEVLSIVDKTFEDLKLGKHIIKISNRKILFGLLMSYNIDEDQSKKIVRLIDKKDKMSEEKFDTEINELLADNEECAEALTNIINKTITPDEVLELIDLDLSETYNEGVRELNEVIEIAKSFGLKTNNLEIDLSLARGLAYYTGMIIETRLVNYVGLGSVCGGGRYDNLTSNFGINNMPGVGISIGLTRILGYVFEKNTISIGDELDTYGILIANMGEDYMAEAIKLSKTLREEIFVKYNKNIIIENYLLDKKLGDQLSYATSKRYKYIIILGEEEMKESCVTLKNLITREQIKINRAELLGELDFN